MAATPPHQDLHTISNVILAQPCAQNSVEMIMHEATSGSGSRFREMGHQRVPKLFAEHTPAEMTDLLSARTAYQPSLPVGLLSVAPQSPAAPSPSATPIGEPLKPTGQAMWLHAVIQEQNKQISELQSQIQRYRQRCFGYRTRAITFKTLYNQQQALLEQTMSFLFHLQCSNRLRQSSALGSNLTSSSISGTTTPA
ncbi:hypothetical protein BKA70DRAFT_1439118 [Coprinopsis sp. MPI-PUGE-AT-0042]|nr:hypothetical protein BKA70DRAFT_1439118 [Coprinopsis sp. MPI-PUGE-AT-0042]